MSTKLIDAVQEAAITTSIIAGIGWVGKKVLKEDLTEDPSKNLSNFAKMTAAVCGAIMLRNYLQKEKYLPTV